MDINAVRKKYYKSHRFPSHYYYIFLCFWRKDSLYKGLPRLQTGPFQTLRDKIAFSNKVPAITPDLTVERTQISLTNDSS